MRLVLIWVALAACGGPELERAGYLGGCTAASAWCVLDEPDGGAELVGAP